MKRIKSKGWYCITTLLSFAAKYQLLSDTFAFGLVIPLYFCTNNYALKAKCHIFSTDLVKTRFFNRYLCSKALDPAPDRSFISFSLLIPMREPL